MDKGTCAAEGCGKPVRTRGLCDVCYHKELLKTAPPCSYEGCDRPSVARGWCGNHWQKWRKTGTPDGRPRQIKPPAICVVDGCDEPVRTREWCAVHYTRWWRTGDPLQEPKFIRGNDEARFWSKVDKRGPSECWLWTGSRNKSNYGMFGFYRQDGGQSNQPAGRWLLGFLRGRPLERGEQACHHCDNPPCVNPAHLYVGSAQDNMRDRNARREWLPSCVNGHPCETCRAERDAEYQEAWRRQANALGVLF
jgi:hypothetical protein